MIKLKITFYCLLLLMLCSYNIKRWMIEEMGSGRTQKKKEEEEEDRRRHWTTKKTFIILKNGKLYC